MTEKLILMHENTPYFIFPLFETFGGGGGRPPCGAAPDRPYSILGDVWI